MLKAIALSILMCGLVLSQEPFLEIANPSLKTLLNSRNLFIEKLDGQLYSLTWKNETHIEIFSTNQTQIDTVGVTTEKPLDDEKCSFDVRKEPFKYVNSSKILDTVVLSGDNKIAAIGFHERPSTDNNTLNTHNYYKIFLLDLIDCEYKMINDAYLNNVPITYPEYDPQLVAYNDSFDVFFAGEHKCIPCRYNNKGEQIELEHKLKINLNEEFSSFHIKLLDRMDTSKTYFYVYNFRNGSAVMKLLDENFEVFKERYVNFNIDVVSVNKDVGAPIGFCYLANGNQSMYCERLDFYMNSILKPLSLTVPTGNTILNATLTLDALGNTFVGVVHASFNSPQKELAVYRYDRYGSSAEALDLDNGENVRISLDRTVQLDSFIVEGMQGQYCLIVYEIRGNGTDHHKTHINCLQAPEDDGF